MKLIRINQDCINHFQAMETALEKHLIHLSSSNNILDKFSTGFGWFQNLEALNEHGIIDLQPKKDISNVMDSLNSFCRRVEVSYDELDSVYTEWDRLMNYLTQLK